MATDDLGNNLSLPSKVESRISDISTHTYMSRKLLANVHQDKGTRMLTAALFLMLQNWKQPKCAPTAR